MMLERRNSPAIAPIFWQESVSQPIDLGIVDLGFEIDGTAYREPANITLRFLPRDRLTFEVTRSESFSVNPSPLFWRGWEGPLQIGDAAEPVDGLLAGIGETEDSLRFEPMRSGVTVSAPCDQIDRTTFHLFNFPDFTGPDDYVLEYGGELKGACRCSLLNLEADGWTVRIAGQKGTRDRVSELNSNGGFVVTHAGEVVRSDGSPYSSAELDELLTCLQYFLSFVTGRWAGVALPIGWNSAGEEVYKQVGMRITSEGTWLGSCSWFDEHHSDLLKQVFPGFLSLSQSTLWKKPLRESLYWYLGANARGSGIGVDTGLILTQTALELLAWNHCVLDRRMVSPQAFRPRGLNAADKLRLLLSSLQLPLDIPVELVALHAKPGDKWVDSMHAITGIRNSLVHPDSSLKMPDGSYYDAWRLSLWYLDLIYLRLCGHSGKYSNRLKKRWVGTIEEMP